MKRFGRNLKRTVLASLCAATALGVVGVPGVHADSRPSSSSTVAGTYVVKSGEWLSRIASKNGVKLVDLMAVNGFSKTTVIHPGQTIKLPGSTTASVAVSAPSSGSSTKVVAAGTYVVKPGDFFARIASKTGVKVSDLLSVNGFSKTTVIHPGQTIKLPSGATSTSTSNSSAAPVLSAATVKLIKVVEFAKAQVGKPYQFGAVGPDAYDCSGLVRAAYRQIGISLPHSSYWQSFRGTAVDWRNETIQPGDLVFTYSSANPTQISHVGIAISDSQWIEAPYTGANVRITRMPSDSRIQEVRRIVTG
ncbi:MAG: C40 family peptidase [Ilumatobacteraceae bacterium]|nr:LysM peptidoglycan-binding domain-containing protein [Actinomycetota bacterium]MDA3011651.1 LysM peptidoglycan-binding domain-containing protein [Actinomycetota bacterium]MDA3025179.1 LysM peptidoglycan-binding domain-containing protein [Actinomycetota bacterium]